jgi:hypothetical protein
MNILNRERHQQQIQIQPTRNITPNFLRFKSTTFAIQSDGCSNLVTRKIMVRTVAHHERASAASTCTRSEY